MGFTLDKLFSPDGFLLMSPKNTKWKQDPEDDLEKIKKNKPCLTDKDGNLPDDYKERHRIEIAQDNSRVYLNDPEKNSDCGGKGCKAPETTGDNTWAASLYTLDNMAYPGTDDAGKPIAIKLERCAVGNNVYTFTSHPILTNYFERLHHGGLQAVNIEPSLSLEEVQKIGGHISSVAGANSFYVEFDEKAEKWRLYVRQDNSDGAIDVLEKTEEWIISSGEFEPKRASQISDTLSDMHNFVWWTKITTMSAVPLQVLAVGLSVLLGIYSIKKGLEMAGKGKEKSSTLKLAINLTEQAKKGELKDTKDMETYMKQLDNILGKEKVANAILLGPPGTGKSTLFKGFVLRASKDPRYANTEFYLISATDIKAGMTHYGEIEERMKMLLDEVKARQKAGKPIVLIIDEFHSLFLNEQGRVIKPNWFEDWKGPLADKVSEHGLRVIAATTDDEYDPVKTSNPALTSRFSDVLLSEKTPEETFKILKNRSDKFRKDSGTGFKEEALQKIIDLTINEEGFFPRKALDGVLEEMISAAKEGKYSGEITADQVIDYVATNRKMTKAELYSLLEAQKNQKEREVEKQALSEESTVKKILGDQLQNQGISIEEVTEKVLKEWRDLSSGAQKSWRKAAGEDRGAIPEIFIIDVVTKTSFTHETSLTIFTEEFKRSSLGRQTLSDAINEVGRKGLAESFNELFSEAEEISSRGELIMALEQKGISFDEIASNMLQEDSKALDRPMKMIAEAITTLCENNMKEKGIVLAKNNLMRNGIIVTLEEALEEKSKSNLKENDAVAKKQHEEDKKIEDRDAIKAK